jgi:long-subunit acyl-CoA synthetase (AMP-forming)
MEGFLLAGENAERNRAWLEAATQRVELQQAGEPVPAELEERCAEADRELFAGIRGMLGLDQLASVNVGAAPTPREVIVFFHAIGVPLAELWGMSETCGAGCCNPQERIKIGSVGPAAPGVELKLGDDGELLMRSEVVMTGYRGLPDKTAEALDADGWLHTGDIAEIDEDGYVTIVDRKKELIINAAGKNMSPANIESTVKGASPLIGQACVIGDARPFNTALVILDADFAPAWAAQRGLEPTDLASLADEPAVREAVQADIDKANDKLARVEQIKRFTILAGDWAPGGEELTPTMKLKRRPIERRYAEHIESMYA